MSQVGVLPTQFALINQSKNITDIQLFIISQALNQILSQFCTEWNIKSAVTIPVYMGKVIPNNCINIYIQNKPDIVDSCGYHSVENNIPYAKVFVKTIQDSGGGILNSNTPSTSLSVARVISREVFIILLDILYDTWWITLNGSAFYDAEICDPVQENIIPVTIVTLNGTHIVGISDYILPSWSNPRSINGPYNKLNTLITPMTVDKRGYIISVTAGTVRYIFGEFVQDEVKAKQNLKLINDKRFSSLTIDTDT